jgi:zinc protease
MIARILASFCAASALAAAACAPAAPVGAPGPGAAVGIPATVPDPLPEPPVTFPPFEEFRLANGLEVIHVRHAVQPIANATLYFRVGGADDPAERAGRAAMAADLLTKGTATRTAEQISEAIEGVGGSLWAAADADFVTVSSTVLADDLPLAVELLADVTRRPTFPADEVELVRQRTLSGLQAALGQPGEIARRRFVREVYGEGHPYGVSPTPGTVRAVTRAELQALHDRGFRPDNAVLVIAGAVDPLRAQRLAELHFGDWAAAGAPARAGLPNPQPPAETRIALVHRPGAVQATIRVGHLGIRPHEPDFFALEVMNRVLGGGFTSRLMQRLRDQLGWTYGAGSGFTLPREVGVFSVSTDVRTAVADSAVVEILAQLRALRDGSVEPAEMQSSVRYLVGNFPLSIETAGQIAGRIARARLLGRPMEHLTQYRERVLEVTPDDIARAARAHVHPDRTVVVVVGDATQLLPRLTGIAPLRLYDVEGAPLDPATFGG